MCIQDWTIYHCGCQKKGDLRVCGEYYCDYTKDLGKSKEDYCKQCQEKLERGEPLPERKKSFLKRIATGLGLRVHTSNQPGHGSNSSSLQNTPESAEWPNPFADPE
ncbi:hypothetical protein TWF694_007827 [Orbilia ellipsospora]|uniref:Uncharacterized protein n=1 Tax=Orbilia ellipsospora TaxID=2528407 RepID=A0AAV9XJV0_9PEZI